MSLHDKEKARMAVFPQPFGLSTLTEITLQGGFAPPPAFILISPSFLLNSYINKLTFFGN